MLNGGNVVVRVADARLSLYAPELTPAVAAQSAAAAAEAASGNALAGPDTSHFFSLI